MRKTGFVCLFGTFLIWGSLFVESKVAMAALTPIQTLALRYAGAFLVLLLVVRLKFSHLPKIRKGHLKYFLLIGLIGYGASMTFQQIGNDLLDASVASLICSLTPLVVPVLAAVFLKETMTRQKWVGIVISLVGVAMILWPSGSSQIRLSGIFCTVMSMLCWSSCMIWIKKVTEAYHPLVLTCYGIGISLIYLVPWCAIEWIQNPPVWTGRIVFSKVYLAVVCTALSHVLWNEALRRLEATTCSMFYPVQPLTSSVLGIFLLGEGVSLRFLLGTAIIFVGMVSAFYVRKHKKTRSALQS